MISLFSIGGGEGWVGGEGPLGLIPTLGEAPTTGTWTGSSEGELEGSTFSASIGLVLDYCSPDSGQPAMTIDHNS